MNFDKQLFRGVKYSHNLQKAAQNANMEQMILPLLDNGESCNESVASLRDGTSYFLGKCVLITGASSGIGRTLAFWYLNNGARVALVGRDVAEMDKIAKQFPS